MIPRFRAWHKEYNVIADMLRLDFIGNEIWVNIAMMTDETDEVIPHRWAFDKIELMQWTGLQDKNGKDIYVGDIIASEGYGPYCPKAIIDDLESFFYNKCEFALDGEEIEILGNIYENPELLEKK